jgi:hypothetical protein
MRQTVVVDLTRTIDELWKAMTKARRQDIEKAIGYIEDEPQLGDVQQFLKLERTKRAEKGMGPIPTEVLETGYLLVAKVEGTAVAAMHLHACGDRMVLRMDVGNYEWPEEHAALTWHAMLWAKLFGFREFDFGGYNEEKHPGVSFWKKSFGGTVCMREAPP